MHIFLQRTSLHTEGEKGMSREEIFGTTELNGHPHMADDLAPVQLLWRHRLSADELARGLKEGRFLRAKLRVGFRLSRDRGRVCACVYVCVCA